jgi:L-amino acid N-acyltransferase YncA/ADP-ribose pyrophosphatase YjhB (NUDIX family)
MLKVNFYDSVEDSLLQFAVIVARSNGKWVFCKHRERNTYECPGGHREVGENIRATAERELYEETGAVDYRMKQICVYSVSSQKEKTGKREESYGMLYYADITGFDPLPGYEIEKVELFDQLPECWTYPEIQPLLLERVKQLIGDGTYTVRMAALEDALDIYAIYEPYILNTAITFENQPVPLEEFRLRMKMVLEQFPWLVCEREGKIVGYAYCARFKERAAFDWDCECSVYIDENEHRKGIASLLYKEILELVRKQGYFTVYALITNSHQSSIAFHERFGFTKVGVFERTGYKFEKWWDLLVMEKRLRAFDEKPTRLLSIHEIYDGK